MAAKVDLASHKTAIYWKVTFTFSLDQRLILKLNTEETPLSLVFWQEILGVSEAPNKDDILC